MSLARAAALQERLGPSFEALRQHPVYGEPWDAAALRVLMAHHVFAVWDFMMLVKALQRRLAGTDVPWRPVGEAAVRRAIGLIVVGEEADELPDGRIMSHFELYLSAMEQAGASTDQVRCALGLVAAGLPVDDALRRAGAPRAIRRFVAVTQRHATDRDVVVTAAAFAFGRERLVPEMFRAWVAALRDADLVAPDLLLYLDRHIGVDEDEHGPAAMSIVAAVCGDDEESWIEAELVAREALAARRDLWDAAHRAARRQQLAVVR